LGLNSVKNLMGKPSKSSQPKKTQKLEMTTMIATIAIIEACRDLVSSDRY